MRRRLVLAACLLTSRQRSGPQDVSPSAANAGIVKRGLIAPDYFADLVVFDPSTVADRADFGHAQDRAVGVRTVWVNGEVVFDNGKTTTAYPGRPLRRTK